MSMTYQANEENQEDAADHSSSRVRSVERAIDLLRALNQQPVSTLDGLHKQTGLPKSSIVRLLRTLEAKGLVNQSLEYGKYHLTSEVRSLSSGFHHEPRIVEAGSKIADSLTEKIKWPLAIAVFDRDAVVIRYSTIPHSPLSLLHSSVNMRLSLVSKALGRAYLAYCSSEEQNLILQILQNSTDPEDALAKQPEKIMRILEVTRAHGYALREPVNKAVSASLAVPIFDNGRVFASLAVTWFASVMNDEQAAEKLYPALSVAAASISEKLLRI